MWSRRRAATSRRRSEDLLASIYDALGIDHGGALADKSQRPIPLLPEGQPTRELF